MSDRVAEFCQGLHCVLFVPGIDSTWSVQKTLRGNVSAPWADITGGYPSLPIVESRSLGHFKCMQCGRQYRWKKTLVAHLRHECGMEPQFKCPYCPMQTKQNSNLKNHIRNKHPDAAIQRRSGKGMAMF